MGPLRALNFTLCTRIPEWHEGAFLTFGQKNKVSGGKVAHSPRELERSQRLIVFEPLGVCEHENMVTGFGQCAEEGSWVDTFGAPLPLF